MPINPSNRVFFFGDQTVRSLGMIELTLQTLRHVQLISVLLDILFVNIAALLGLDI